MTFFLLAVMTYFIGAIPSGVWLGKIFKGMDVRNYGSKNSGATNCYRVLGAKLGATVLIFDVLKGFLPLYISGKYIENFNDLIILGLIAILAHTFSCFINFKGGKGVATSLGVFIYLTPMAIVLFFAVFGLVFYTKHYVSLSSIMAAFFLPIFVGFIYANPYLLALAVAIGVFVIYRHKTNIVRLLYGTENKFKF